MNSKPSQADRRCGWLQLVQLRLNLWFLGLFLGVSAALGDGYFSARNLGGFAVTGEDGQALSKVTGRVEILDEDLLLARGDLCKDGFFALGSVYDPKPGIVRTLTIRAWDGSTGATFEQARVRGHGFASQRLSVSLSAGPNPPTQLGLVSIEFGFANLDVLPGYNLPFYPLGLESFITPQHAANFQLCLPNSEGPAIPLTNQANGLFGFGPATEPLRWTYSLINTNQPNLYGWRAWAVLRLWDASSGTRYETAKVRGAANVDLLAGLTGARLFSSNPFPIELVSADSPPVGVFQAPGGVMQVLDLNGNAIPKGGCQVEILAGTNVLNSFALPEDGRFPLPTTPVPGTLPLDGNMIAVHIWDPGSGASFDGATLVGKIEQVLNLGGDNLPAATLYTNVVRLGFPLPAPPQVVPWFRQRISTAAGSSSSISVTAFGAFLQYQWLFSNTGDDWIALEDTPSLRGTHSATLEFSAATLNQAGRYRVMVSNRGGAVTNTPTAMYVHDSGSIHFTPTPSFHFGSDTILQPVTAEAFPVSLSVTSGPASASALPDGRFRVHPTGVGSVILHATQAASTPYAIIAADFSFPVLKGQQSLLLPNLPPVIESGASIPVTTTASSGLPVVLRVVSGPATLVNGGILQTSGTGTVVFSASQAGNENYEAVDATFSTAVATRPQSVRLIDVGGTFALHFRGDAGRVHLVESAPAAEGPWEEVGHESGTGLDRDTVVPLTGLTGSNRFFRIRIQ